ncbi:MAG: molybdate ABC transporter substrate-binding protein [Nitratireductor sp.]
MKLLSRLFSLLVISGMLLPFAAARSLAGEVRIAVASNFSVPAREIARAFETATGNKVTVSFGSTGKIYAQIVQAAPFDVFMSADQERPQLLEQQGLAVSDSRFTYALGRLALYAGGTDVKGPGLLVADRTDRIAVANPELAPYGRAAVEALAKLFPDEDFGSRLVQGENISQTLQFVETGNARLGLVAYSQVISRDAAQYWLVPEGLHSPIAQDAVLLKSADANPVARAFMDFLRGAEAENIIRRYGYSAHVRGGS